MKLKAWDTIRRQWIPKDQFALTGDGRLLLLRDNYEMSMDMGSDWAEDDQLIADETVVVGYEDA